MKKQIPCALTSDFIIEEDGNLFYVSETAKQRNRKKFDPHFTNFVQKHLITSDRERHSKTMNVSRLKTYTFLVSNVGPNEVTCQTEISPDGISWESFGELELTVSPGKMQVLLPQYFLRFARVKFKNKKSGFPSIINVWFQGQD